MTTGRADVTLEAVVVAVTDGRPRVLTVGSPSLPRLPSGPPAVGVTLERGLRRLLEEQTRLTVGYVEQLYTFGDRGLELDGARRVGVAYLGLTRETRTSATWIDVYQLFPWEDRRGTTDDEAVTRLLDWAANDEARRTRVQIVFGLGDTPWDGVRALERYELMYEAGLVSERHADQGTDMALDVVAGTPMSGDHRRVVATALARVRGKITYRPVVFELVPETFTLARLQRTVEALAGSTIHTQNFRRLVDRGGLVEGTGEQTTTGGRPAELFRFRSDVLTESDRPGVGRW